MCVNLDTVRAILAILTASNLLGTGSDQFLRIIELIILLMQIFCGVNNISTSSVVSTSLGSCLVGNGNVGSIRGCATTLPNLTSVNATIPITTRSSTYGLTNGCCF